MGSTRTTHWSLQRPARLQLVGARHPYQESTQLGLLGLTLHSLPLYRSCICHWK